MTSLHEAARKALEALENAACVMKADDDVPAIADQAMKAIASLRSALEGGMPNADSGMRETFENWYSDDGESLLAVAKNSRDEYVLLQTASAWIAWQAGWQARAQNPEDLASVPSEDRPRTQAMDAFMAHIHQNPQLTVEALARQFHETYERLAPSFGYETRPETRAFDPESANGKLMLATCREVLGVKE